MTFPWLLLLHQVPARPSSRRVRVWRRLLDVGAVPLRGAAYVLPNREEPREDLAWIAADIRALGGQATVLAAAALDPAEEEGLRATFRSARALDYRALRERAQRAGVLAEKGPAAGSSELLREGERLRREAERLAKITFFETKEQEEAREMVERLWQRLKPAKVSDGSLPPPEARAFRGRTWVTRPRPGIDRMASAWLIRTHVDPKARFAFGDLPRGKVAVPFDMYEGEFSHTGGACTFEVLARRFGVKEEGVSWLGRVVHDVDLRDARYGEPEAPGIALLVEGLRAVHGDDHEMLEAGIALFASLVRGRASQRSGPSSSARRKRAPAPSPRASSGRRGRRPGSRPKPRSEGPVR